MNGKPLYYEMDPNLAEYVKAMDQKLRELLMVGVGHLQDLGAESNDALSALAHWASLFVAVGENLTAARMAETMALPLAQDKRDEIALNVFLQDVVERVGARRAP